MAERRRSPFELDRGIENRYAMQLRRLATKIGSFIARFPDLLNDPGQRAILTRDLNAYSELITPWAEKLAARVIREVDLKNRNAFNAHAKEMSRRLKYELAHAPTGATVQRLQAEQVRLIKSLPTEAAQRIQQIAMKNLMNADRAAQYAEEIANSTGVTKSRATLIARTETARIASNLTQARAQYVGSVEYVWETSKDEQVRPSHRKMQGQRVFWADPPVLDNLRGNAGCLPNCRCFPSPVLPDY